MYLGQKDGVIMCKNYPCKVFDSCRTKLKFKTLLQGYFKYYTHQHCRPQAAPKSLYQELDWDRNNQKQQRITSAQLVLQAVCGHSPRKNLRLFLNSHTLQIKQTRVFFFSKTVATPYFAAECMTRVTVKTTLTPTFSASSTGTCPQG